MKELITELQEAIAEIAKLRAEVLDLRRVLGPYSTVEVALKAQEKLRAEVKLMEDEGHKLIDSQMQRAEAAEKALHDVELQLSEARKIIQAFVGCAPEEEWQEELCRVLPHAEAFLSGQSEKPECAHEYDYTIAWPDGKPQCKKCHRSIEKRKCECPCHPPNRQDQRCGACDSIHA